MVAMLSDGSVSLTHIGRSYFKRKQTEYVVQVPVVVSGTDKKGKENLKGKGEDKPERENVT